MFNTKNIERSHIKMKIIAKNPNARHNYNITDTFEAGIVLFGTEIKSIKNR